MLSSMGINKELLKEEVWIWHLEILVELTRS